MTVSDSAERPILNLIGEKVALGPLRRDLVPLYQRWINDFEVTRMLGTGHTPTTHEAECEWFDRSGSYGSVQFTVYEREREHEAWDESLRPIGTTAWIGLDRGSRTAELGIMIGAKDAWNRGYGTEVVRLMLEYGFTVLGLHSAFLRHVGFNERAHRAYVKAGFRVIGRRRESVWWAGKAYDMVYMDCLASEFQGNALAHLRE